MTKILIAEDDRAIRMVLTAKLSSAGFTVRTASDGQEALDIIHAWEPDLVFLDLVMPSVNGIDALREIRAHSEYKDLPVVIASNLSACEEKAKCLELGAQAYIVKAHVSSDQIIEIVNKLTQ